MFKAVLANELIRIFKKRKTFVFLIINLAIMSIYSLLNELISAQIGRGITNLWANLHDVYFAALFPLYIFMETMGIFTWEVSNGQMKTALIRPITRLNLYLSKTMAVSIFIFLQVTIVVIAGVGFSMFQGMPTNLIFTGVASYFITFIPMLAFVFVSSLIAQLVKSPLLGMLFGIFFTLGNYALEVFFPIVSAFSFTRHIKVFKMILAGDLQSSIYALGIFLAYIGFSFAAGYLLFDRKEF